MRASIAFALEAEVPIGAEEVVDLRIISGLPIVGCPEEGPAPPALPPPPPPLPVPLAIAAKVDISGTVPGGGLK